MNRLVRTELLKQRTTRTFVVGLLVGPVVATLGTVAMFSGAGRQGNAPLGSESLLDAVGGPVGVVTAIALVLGVLGMTGEYRHKTITTTFLATPRRRDVVAAKLAAHALTGAALGVLAVAAVFAVAVPWLRASDIAVGVDGQVLRVAAGVIASSALSSALGAAVGGLIRNQAAAITAVLVWLLTVEGFIGKVFSGSSFLRWLPVSAGRSLVHVGSSGEHLAVAVAAAVLVGYVVGFAAAAVRLTVRRDIT